MSQVYSSLPKTHGKVIVVTDCGDIEIELFARETPKACKNFVQLCLEDFYNGLLFHRIVAEQFVQSGDPTNNGDVGESIYECDESGKGKAFEAEYHSRLKFSQKGLVACASQNNMSDSRFFVTLNRLDALNFKHTIFGQVVGNTIYSVLKIAEMEVDDNDRPIYPPKIIRTEVIVNPFPDIVPRKKVVGDSNIKKRKKKENKNVLSFSDDIEDNVEELKPRKKDKKEHIDTRQKEEVVKLVEPVEIPKSNTPIETIREPSINVQKNEVETVQASTENENLFDDVASRFSSLRKKIEEQDKNDSENKTKQDAKQYLNNQLQKYKKKSSKEERESKALEKFESFSNSLKSTSTESWKKHGLNYKKE